MPMQIQYGQFDPKGPESALAPVVFPSLASLDLETGDGREIVSDGFSSRTLPRSIMAQFVTEGGHRGAVVVGTLQEATVEADGNVSGRGWLVDTPEARHLALLNRTGSLTGNSIDMADVEVELRWKSDDPNSPDYWDYTLLFTKAKLAATTFVNVPAFADAYGEVGELIASFKPSDEPIVFNFTEHEYVVDLEPDELTASLATEVTVPWADFHQPEGRTFQKICIDENGVVTGNLAKWGDCHRGIDGVCTLAPRPHNYASFAAPSVLTERGMVETGPIFFLGGHPDKPIGNGDPWAAYGGIENAWADVTITNGIHGPWLSGRVRPGLSAESVYMARASRISGHWKNGELIAIVSCNVPAFNSPGSGKPPELLMPGSTMHADRDGVRVENGKVVELVASAGRIQPEPEEDPEEIRARLAAQIKAKLNGTTQTMTVIAPPATDFEPVSSTGASMFLAATTEPDVEPDDDFDNETEILALELEIAKLT